MDRNHSDHRIRMAVARLAVLATAFVIAGGLSLSEWSSRTATPATPSGLAATSGGSESHVGRPTAAPSATMPLTPTTITVPAIGVSSTLVELGLTDEGALDVPTEPMAAGWYTGSPVPGLVGPSVVVGHVHWDGVPGVFARLADLSIGDSVMVSRSDGSTVAFAVDLVTTYPKTEFPTELVYGNIGYPGLRLITCGGYDPVARSYEANVIVFATRVTT